MSLSSIWKEIEAWFAAILHHAHAGTLPPAPTVASGPVSLPPVPAAAPVHAPAASAAVAAAAAVAPPTPVVPLAPPATPVVASVSGMTLVQPSDSVAYVTLDLIDAEIAKNPNWAKACHNYLVPAMLFTFTLTNAQQKFVSDALATSTVMGDASSLDGRGIQNNAIDLRPVDPPGGILAFQQAFVMANLAAWIDGCNAAYAKNPDPLQGVLPIIDHSHIAPIAGM